MNFPEFIRMVNEAHAMYRKEMEEVGRALEERLQLAHDEFFGELMKREETAVSAPSKDEWTRHPGQGRISL